MPQPRRAVLKNTIAITIGLVAAFVVGEVGVRVLDIPPKMLPPLDTRTYQLSGNPILKYTYRPEYTAEDEPFTGALRGFATNNDGFRDREYAKPKPPGVTRIAVLGDSITAGVGIEDPDHTCVRMLEQRLADAKTFGAAEVVNMGVGGYNTLQEAELLHVKGLDYEPDIVVVGFCVNDFSWRSTPIESMLAEADADRHGALFAASPEARPWFRFLLNHSRLLFVIYHHLVQPSAREERSVEIPGFAIEGDDPVEMGFALLDELRAQHGFDVYVFLIPAFDNLWPEYAYNEIHRRAFSLAGRHADFRVADLLGDFREQGDDPSPFTQDGLHPNERGHALIAEVMARYLTSWEQTAAPSGGEESFLANGSFEVWGDSGPAGWYTAHPEQVLRPAGNEAAAFKGERCLRFRGAPGEWTGISQALRLSPGHVGRAITVSAWGKSPVTNGMFLSVKMSAKGEKIEARGVWPECRQTWTRVQVEITVPESLDCDTARVVVSFRPGEDVVYTVDGVAAE